MFKNKVKIIKFFPVSFLLIVLLFILNFLLFPAERVLAAGNTTGYAWSQEGGWIDFNPTGGGVTVSDTKLTGYAWGDEAGWINFDCAATPGECPSDTQKVTNDSNGNLSGYAWGAEIGWLNFNCQAQAGCPSGSQKVVINGTTGNFSGYAWCDEIGWVSFEAGDGANVNTTWRSCDADGTTCSTDSNCCNGNCVLDYDGTGIGGAVGGKVCSPSSPTKQCWHDGSYTNVGSSSEGNRCVSCIGNTARWVYTNPGRFIVKKKGGGNKMILDKNGQLLLAGSKKPWASPDGGDWLVKSAGVPKAWLDDVFGHLYLIGGSLLEQQTISPAPGSELLIKTKTGAYVGKIDASGNMQIKGQLGEGCSLP